MFNPMQHQLMCEIEGIENAAGAAVGVCEDEEWEHIPECLNSIFRRFHAAFRIAQQLNLIPPDPVDNSKPIEITENKAIEKESSNA